MRRLILMRHAKSSWDDPKQRDLDRPLNKRGRRSATLIGDWLKAHDCVPTAALVSTARRTQETWAGVVRAAGPAPTSYVPELYQAGAEAMLAELRKAPDAAVVLMLGHQPGIGDFARRLLRTPAADPDFAKFPTGATAVIEFDVAGWPDAGWTDGELAHFVVPRNLE